jgi:hypothetical protein
MRCLFVRNEREKQKKAKDVCVCARALIRARFIFVPRQFSDQKSEKPARSSESPGHFLKHLILFPAVHTNNACIVLLMLDDDSAGLSFLRPSRIKSTRLPKDAEMFSTRFRPETGSNNNDSNGTLK